LASLQARSSLRSAHPLFYLNKLVTLTAFIFLLGAGWIAVSYLKNEIVARNRATSEGKTPASLNPTTARTDAAVTPETRRLSVPVRLVYACSVDKEHYHLASHLPERSDRIALSEEAALRRGLKRCHVCFPE
jgi:hypothetical protein